MPQALVAILQDQSPRLVTTNGLQIREDSLYTNHKGEEKERIRGRADKAIEKLNEILRRVLGPDEAILYVARCQAPVGLVEQLTMGWYLYQVTAAVLVFTNFRVLHFHVKRGGEWKRSLRAVRYGDLEEAKMKGWLNRTLQLKYRDGKKETYWRLRRDDSKKIKVLLEAVLPASRGEASSAGTMVSLCPGCLSELTPHVYECGKCGAKFKNERTMVWRSLLIPGGGYFYVGEWFIGFLDFLVEAVLGIQLVIFTLVALGVLEMPADPGEEPVTASVAIAAVVFLGFVLAVEKWATIHHCRRFVREYIPAE